MPVVTAVVDMVVVEVSEEDSAAVDMVVEEAEESSQPLLSPDTILNTEM